VGQAAWKRRGQEAWKAYSRKGDSRGSRNLGEQRGSIL
jgi:hypothetical protein